MPPSRGAAAMPPPPPSRPLTSAALSSDVTDLPLRSLVPKVPRGTSARGQPGAPPSQSVLARTLHERLGAEGGEARGGGRPLLLLRCSRVFNSRVAAYLAGTPYECTLCGLGGEFLAFDAANADEACTALQADPNLRRAVGGFYVIDACAPTAAALGAAICARLSAAQAPGGGAATAVGSLAAARGVRLHVYPRKSVQAELETCLPPNLELRPNCHGAELHAVRLAPYEGSSGQLFAWSLRPVDGVREAFRRRQRAPPPAPPPAPSPAPSPAPPPSLQPASGQEAMAEGQDTMAEGQDVMAEAMRRLGVPFASPVLILVDDWRPLPPSVAQATECTRLVPTGKALELAVPPPAPPAASVSPVSTAAGQPTPTSSTEVVGARTFASCAVLIEADHERLATVLSDELPPLLRPGATLLVNLPLPRDERSGGEAIGRLVRRLASAGYAHVRVHWLFANGPTERTLCCTWMGGA